MKSFLASIILLGSIFFSTGCGDDDDACDKDGDGFRSVECGGDDCNDDDKNIGGQVDLDGDGSTSSPCGGNDCDDNDPRRYPNATEENDPDHIDEDCNATTCGGRDNDGDGYPEVCFNTINDEDFFTSFGDCDDTNPAIFPGSQVCGTQGKILICTGNGGYLEENCNTCIAQPNGTGVCGPQ